MAESIEVRIYVDERDKCPFVEWLEQLDAKTQTRVERRLDRVRAGNLGDCQSVGDGVHELRFFFGPGYRVYFGKEGSRIILLLTGGDKSRQSRDIKAAKKMWQTYLEELNG